MLASYSGKLSVCIMIVGGCSWHPGVPRNRLSTVTVRSPWETILFLTHRYTYLCTPAWEDGGGGVSHCQLLRWIHTESKTTTHVRYTCVQMQQELHILVLACLCQHVPSLHVGHRCITSEMLKSSICLWWGHLRSTIYTCGGRCGRGWGLPFERPWEARLCSLGAVRGEDIDQNSEEWKLLPQTLTFS